VSVREKKKLPSSSLASRDTTRGGGESPRPPTRFSRNASLPLHASHWCSSCSSSTVHAVAGWKSRRPRAACACTLRRRTTNLVVGLITAKCVTAVMLVYYRPSTIRFAILTFRDDRVLFINQSPLSPHHSFTTYKCSRVCLSRCRRSYDILPICIHSVKKSTGNLSFKTTRVKMFKSIKIM